MLPHPSPGESFIATQRLWGHDIGTKLSVVTRDAFESRFRGGVSNDINRTLFLEIDALHCLDSKPAQWFMRELEERPTFWTSVMCSRHFV